MFSSFSSCSPKNQSSKALGITLMDAGHYATEQVVCPKIVEYLARCFPALEVRMSRTHREVYGWV